MRLKAAMHRPVSAASVPPATTASASPRAIIRAASPIAWAPVAHARGDAEAGAVGAEAHRDRAGGRVGHHHRHEVRRDGAVAALQPGLALALQRRRGRRRRCPRARRGARGRRRRAGRPPRPPASPRPPRAACSGRRGAPPSATSATSGSKSTHAPMPSAMPERLRQQGVEEGVGALADRGDDAAAGDDDSGASRGRTRLLARELLHEPAASPTVAIDFSRPSAIWTS